MPCFTIPAHAADLVEFNPCHAPAGSPEGGQFCATPGGAPSVPARRGPRPRPIRVHSVEAAVALILQGKVVELPDVRRVNTVLRKLAAYAEDAVRRGEQAPSYDLCNVSVPGTNLFCAGRLRSPEFPKGIPRLEMPQFSGKPRPGTPADRLPRKPSGSVDGGPAFIAHVQSLGIAATRGTLPAAKLKASQAELIGPEVARMMTARGYNPAAQPIFVSRDGYVVDGHHRWAAVVGRDAADGRLGQSRMKVVRLDAPMSELYHLATRWAAAFGIAPKSTRERFTEANPCHTPAGSPEGGQFCSGESFGWAAIRPDPHVPGALVNYAQRRARRIAQARLGQANPWGLPQLRIAVPQAWGEDTLHAIRFEHGTIQLIATPQAPDRLVVQQIELDARLRGQGYGQKLLLAARSYAHSLGFKGIVSYQTERAPEASRAWAGLKRKGYATRVVRSSRPLLSGYTSTTVELFD